MIALRKRILLLLLCLCSAVDGVAAGSVAGRHFIYAQYDFILTLEFTAGKEVILNVINLGDQTFTLRAQNIALVDDQDAGVKVDRIILETGNPSDPYLTPMMKILPNSFIGLVLKGKFDSVKEFKSVAVQLGTMVLHLDSVSAPAFDNAADKINKMNFDSPNIREDFRVLKMEFLGRREPAGQPTRP